MDGEGSSPDPAFRALVEAFSLAPLADDSSYRAAIAILDRLFALEGSRTPAERRYFRALARNAYQYERSCAMI